MWRHGKTHWNDSWAISPKSSRWLLSFQTSTTWKNNTWLHKVQAGKGSVKKTLSLSLCRAESTLHRQHSFSGNFQGTVSYTFLCSQAFLKASILGAKPLWAMSAVFLLDRFLYWIDSSHTLLKIAKALHRHHPETPVAPQIVIRQARVYLNTGELILNCSVPQNGAGYIGWHLRAHEMHGRMFLFFPFV